MPIIEMSYADRLQRARSLEAAIAQFAVAFDPADPSLTSMGFQAFLAQIDQLNLAVSEAESEWRESVAQRQQLAEEIKSLAQRAGSRVKSNQLWDLHLPAVKALVGEIRGYRPPLPKLPPEEKADAEPPRNRGGQSYGDLKALLDKLIAALTLIPDYNTAAPAGISIPDLTATSAQLLALNKLNAENEQTLLAKRAPRRVAYDGPNGLREKMIATKNAVQSQYGSKSAEYLAVKSIKV